MEKFYRNLMYKNFIYFPWKSLNDIYSEVFFSRGQVNIHNLFVSEHD